MSATCQTVIRSATLPSDSNYRPDIDGLRAMAVMSVVLYHAGIPGLSGGFIGVDVFFVISGFLITTQLISNRDIGFRSLLANFYARRARRILPSLTVVTTAALLLGWFFLLPDGDQQDLAKSAIASALFVSNIFFWSMRKDYFAGPAELQPLLHTWSLSVEEQYYLILPFMLLVVWTIERKFIRRPNSLVCPTLVVLSAASLVSSVWLTASDPPAAFFLIPSRFWELGTGAVLGITMTATTRVPIPGLLRLIGLTLIVVPMTAYTPETAFPGFAACAPVAGTALVIAAGLGDQHGLLYRLLTSPPMLTTGTISYAWYLWHWPLLAVARAVDLGAHNIARDTFLVALAYTFAYLSTRYLEGPIRQKRLPPFTTSFSSLLGGLGLILITATMPFGLWISAYSKYYATYARLWWPSVSCLTSYEINEAQPSPSCILSRGPAGSVFLIGDSHASHWAPLVAEWASNARINAVERSTTGCDVLIVPDANKGLMAGSTFDYPPKCKAFSESIIDAIHAGEANGKLVGVILSANWLLPRYGSAEDIRTKLNAGLTSLEHLGIRALIIAPSPIFPSPVPKCVGYRNDDTCRLPRQQYDAATKAVTTDLKLLVSHHRNARLWDPTSQFCDSSWCYPTSSGSLLFSDTEHISPYAAKRAKSDLDPDLNWLIKNDLP